MGNQLLFIDHELEQSLVGVDVSILNALVESVHSERLSRGNPLVRPTSARL